MTSRSWTVYFTTRPSGTTRVIMIIYINWCLLSLWLTLWGDKVSMLTHAYPHKFQKQIKWSSGITRLTVHVTWCLISWFASIEKSMVIHDTEYLYWDQVSLNNTLKLSLWLTLIGWMWVTYIVLYRLWVGLCQLVYYKFYFQRILRRLLIIFFVAVVRVTESKNTDYPVDSYVCVSWLAGGLTLSLMARPLRHALYRTWVGTCRYL